jgi:hypothetical protein
MRGEAEQQYTRQVDKATAKAIVDEIREKVDEQKLEQKLMEEGNGQVRRAAEGAAKLIAKSARASRARNDVHYPLSLYRGEGQGRGDLRNLKDRGVRPSPALSRVRGEAVTFLFVEKYPMRYLFALVFVGASLRLRRPRRATQPAGVG